MDSCVEGYSWTVRRRGVKVVDSISRAKIRNTVTFNTSVKYDYITRN